MLVFIVCVMVSACTQNAVTPVVVKSNEELLAGTNSKTWDLVSVVNSAGIDRTSIYSAYSFEYKRDGSFKQNAQFVGQTPFTVNATWRMVNNRITTTTGVAPLTAATVHIVDELTETSLKLSSPDPTDKTKIILKSR